MEKLQKKRKNLTKLLLLFSRQVLLKSQNTCENLNFRKKWNISIASRNTHSFSLATFLYEIQINGKLFEKNQFLCACYSARHIFTFEISMKSEKKVLLKLVCVPFLSNPASFQFMSYFELFEQGSLYYSCFSFYSYNIFF